MSEAPPDPRLVALRELLAEDPDILADLEAAFADPRRGLPRDIDLGLAGPAWETFVARGLAPASDDRRAFIARSRRRCPDCRGLDLHEDCRTCLGAGLEIVDTRTAEPPTLRAALALTAAPTALPTAEALAHEAAVRLWSWRGTRRARPVPGDPPRAFTWRVHDDPGPLELVRHHRAACPLLFEAMARLARDHARSRELNAFSRLAKPLYPWTPAPWWYRRQPTWPADPEVDRLARDFYDELAAAGARAPAAGLHANLPTHVPTGPLADLPNPFTPLCALADLGVTVERLSTDGVALVRPA